MGRDEGHVIEMNGLGWNGTRWNGTGGMECDTPEQRRGEDGNEDIRK